MAILGDLTKSAGGAGPVLLVGAGALILGPTLLRMAGRAARPVAKTAVRTVVRTAGAARDGFSDMVEQSRREMDEAAQARAHRPSRSRGRAAPAHDRTPHDRTPHDRTPHDRTPHDRAPHAPRA